MKVSNAINILNSTIDNKICGGNGNWSSSNAETPEKCNSGASSDPNSHNKGLSDMFSSTTSKSNYATTKDQKMGNHTSAKISKKDTSELTREEKGVVSSVFARSLKGQRLLKSGARYIFLNIYLRRICMKVSNAINILNSNIDGKLCKDTNNKCKKASNDGNAVDTGGKLSEVFKDISGHETEKFTAHNAAIVSKDTAGLTREEKGVVSSVFAKVIEGAEIL